MGILSGIYDNKALFVIATTFLGIGFGFVIGTIILAVNYQIAWIPGDLGIFMPIIFGLLGLGAGIWDIRWGRE